MRAFVGMGSNLGEREALIGQALDELATLPDTTLIRVSSLYDTEPVGVIEQPRFWNLQRIEARLGRTRSQRWGPRTMDLDLLLYGDLVIEEDDLRLPHPELARRAFVLVPLVELDPQITHPVSGLSVVQMLARLEHKSPIKRISRLRTRG